MILFSSEECWETWSKAEAYNHNHIKIIFSKNTRKALAKILKTSKISFLIHNGGFLIKMKRKSGNRPGFSPVLLLK